MTKDKLLIEFIQSTYEMESMTIKCKSLYKRVRDLHAQLDYTELTTSELELVSHRIDVVTDHLQEVSK